MKEKTLRYPGHRELMQIFSESGLFSLDPIEVDGDRVRPRDVFSALVFPAWTYGPDEADLTVMRVIVEGVQNGQAVRHQWDLLDRSEPAGGPSSMARTTAYPCAIVARLIATGRYRRPGVSPPELLGQESGMLETVLQELESRNVRFNKS